MKTILKGIALAMILLTISCDNDELRCGVITEIKESPVNHAVNILTIEESNGSTFTMTSTSDGYEVGETFCI